MSTRIKNTCVSYHFIQRSISVLTSASILDIHTIIFDIFICSTSFTYTSCLFVCTSYAVMLFVSYCHPVTDCSLTSTVHNHVISIRLRVVLFFLQILSNVSFLLSRVNKLDGHHILFIKVFIILYFYCVGIVGYYEKLAMSLSLHIQQSKIFSCGRRCAFENRLKHFSVI